jgi:SAM-dependent methyltransferase
MMLGERYVFDGKAVIPLSDKQSMARTILLQNMKKQYSFLSVNCECGNDSYEVLSEKDRYGLPVTTGICKKCGLIYQNPRLCPESLKDFYRRIYRTLYEESMPSKCFTDQLYRGKRIVRRVYRSLGRLPKRVVEVGCGAGGILKAFQNMGATTLGVDLDEDYINYGRRNGIQLYIGGSEKLPKNYADLVILSHVLEHFSDIGKELAAIQDLLVPQGFLYIELPGVFRMRNYSYDFLKSLQNAHNYYFTLKTLEQVLGFHGWKLNDGDESIFGIFKYSSPMKGPLRNYYAKISRYLLYLEKTRYIGRLRSVFSPTLLLQTSENILLS